MALIIYRRYLNISAIKMISSEKKFPLVHIDRALVFDEEAQWNKACARIVHNVGWGARLECDWMDARIQMTSAKYSNLID